MLAEYVRTYPDGTCSVVHGGFGVYWFGSLPAVGLACLGSLKQVAYHPASTRYT
jgi:hypothetical protein